MATEYTFMRLAACVAAGFVGAAGALADTATLPTPQELEQRHATIGSIAIHVDNIFDEDDPRENRLLYRWANDLHIHTRDSTVTEQLLIKPGDAYSAQKAEETARNLRQRDYLSEAEVITTAYDPDSNTVDLKVRVRDVWTLEPGVGFGRTGGSNKTRIRLADENFLGFGQNLALEYKSNVDRSGYGIEFTDPNVFQSWWALTAHYADNSDGKIYTAAVAHPFYSLDSRWSLGFAGQSIEQVTPLYDLGETVTRFNSKYDGGGFQGGISDGLVNGWTRRWLAGYRYDRARFGPAPDEPPPLLLPEDRTLSYPWVGMELIQNNYVTTENQDQIGRTEDLYLGERLLATLGWSTPAFGADGTAGIYSFGAEMGRPFGRSGILRLATSWNGRYESGSTVDSVLDANARYYRRFNEKNLFVVKLGAAHAQALDLDQQLQLGGDNGLRGYPLRYQTGDTRFLATVEERYFTDWFPWRLFRVGGAVFTDVGRMWGQAPLASEPLGWLSDVGFGLRIGNARSGIGNVLHIDLAFPIGAPNDVSSTQLLIEAEKSF